MKGPKQIENSGRVEAGKIVFGNRECNMRQQIENKGAKKQKIAK